MATVIKKIAGLTQATAKYVSKVPNVSTELYKLPLIDDANLVSYFRFEDNSNDVKNAHNGTATDVTYDTSYGKFNKGGSFNGSSSKVSLASAPIIGTGSAYSINIWIKTSTSSGVIQLYTEGNSSNATPIVTLSVANGRPYLYQRNDAGSYNEIYPSNNIADGNWHMITLVKASETDYKIYLDGNSTAIGSSSTSAATPITLNTNHIGVLQRTSFSGYFNGYIDDLSLFNRALTTLEISNLYNTNIKKFMGVSNI